MRLFAGFFDENSHFRVRRFEVHGQVVVFEALAGGGADGRDDHLSACFFELRGGAFLFE